MEDFWVFLNMQCSVYSRWVCSKLRGGAVSWQGPASPRGPAKPKPHPRGWGALRRAYPDVSKQVCPAWGQPGGTVAVARQTGNNDIPFQE